MNVASSENCIVRVPPLVWLVLLAVGFLSIGGTGYYCGLTKSRNIPQELKMVLAFSIVLHLLVDLDRPRDGLIMVSQRTMLDLKRSLAE